MKLRAFLPLFALAALVTTSAVADLPRAATAAPKRANARFYELHASFLRRAAEGPVGVFFLGDSITEGWTKVPELWESAWGAYQPANFGIGGDQTQHVLWRIADGSLDKISPQVVVLMIGTNNTGGDSAEDIITANRLIVEQIRAKLPETKILLLAIFPRGPRLQRDGNPEPWEMRMEKIRTVNADLATLDDGKTIRFLDLGPKFMAADGTITKTIMPDQLHLSPAGYQIWVEAMSPLLAEMMQ